MSNDSKNCVFGYAVSLFSIGTGAWTFMERAVTVLSILSLLIGITVGILTGLNQWATYRTRHTQKGGTSS